MSNWRALLGLLAGVLLTVPLLLLLGRVLLPVPRGSDASGARVSPVLDVEERTRRVTYHRYCQHSSECEAPLGCFMDLRAGTPYCTDSQCSTDEQCPDDQRCRALATVGGGPSVRFCIPVGVRQEGERCINLPRDRDAACGPDLLCGGSPGWCGRPCNPAEAAGCPEGFFCVDVLPQAMCLPTCEARGCTAGQQCVRFKEGVSACAVVYGPACQQSPCPHGRECDVFSDARRPGKVWTECVERCGEQLPPCSEGLVCDAGRCQRPCDPEQSETCAEGYRCQQRRSNRPWVCLPDR